MSAGCAASLVSARWVLEAAEGEVKKLCYWSARVGPHNRHARPACHHHLQHYLAHPGNLPQGTPDTTAWNIEMLVRTLTALDLSRPVRPAARHCHTTQSASYPRCPRQRHFLQRSPGSL